MRLMILFLLLITLLIVSCSSLVSNPEYEVDYEQELEALSDVEVTEIEYLENSYEKVALVGNAYQYKEKKRDYEEKTPSAKKITETKKREILKKVSERRREAALRKISDVKETETFKGTQMQVPKFFSKMNPFSCTCGINHKTIGLPGAFSGTLLVDGRKDVEWIFCGQNVYVTLRDDNLCEGEVVEDILTLECVEENYLKWREVRQGVATCI
jgi:DNA polymerase II small subunit/DNA polymerase delta subunit B